LVVGVGVLFGSYIILFMVILFLVLIWVYVPLEEALLFDLFGEEYIYYQNQVKRCL
jgi:protein-S-isoprenylcysteine O-methyltransferase Ste14